MFDIPCVIFAGGKSSRMGKDKALLPFGGAASLTEYQYQRLSKLFTHVYISSKDISKFNFDAPFIPDPESSAAFAPTAGFVAAFDYLEDDRFFALSVDTPFVDQKVIQHLVNEDRPTYDATIARSPEGLHPVCGIYHRSLAPAFQQMLLEDKHKLGMLLKKSSAKEVFFEEDYPFSNLNHPHEYEKALSQIPLQ